jgi:hypothetical protein
MALDVLSCPGKSPLYIWCYLDFFIGDNPLHLHQLLRSMLNNRLALAGSMFPLGGTDLALCQLSRVWRFHFIQRMGR